MIEEEKEAIGQVIILKNLLKGLAKRDYEPSLKTVLNLIQKQQEEIENKDKIIDLLIDELTCYEFDRCCSECTYECEKDYFQLSTCIKQYFKNKVEEE